MLSTHLKKSIAASAVLASSVAMAIGATAPAQAAPAGPAASPLTLDRGAWAPDGSRYVFVGSDGAVRTQSYGGGVPYIVDPAKPGVSRSHPTWFAGGTAIVFSETVGGASKIMAVPAYTPEGTAVQETSPLSFLASHMTQGTESAPDSNGRTLAFQHRDTGAEEDQIWVQDAFGRGSGGPIEATDNGATPSVSPDGKTIAFVRTDEATGAKQIWTVPWYGQNATPSAGTPVQLTRDGNDHTNPTWSADGGRIAFEQGPKGAAAASVQSVAKDGSGLRQESASAGVPNYQPRVADTVSRLAGADRIGTAIATSQSEWPTAPYADKPGTQTSQAGAVVLARYDLPFDALGGGALAASQNGPLLLTPGDHLDATVKAEIARVLGSASQSQSGVTPTVYVLGGEQALSPAVFNAVKAMGYKVERIAGADRYATSVAIAKAVTGPYNGPARIMVATGRDFPDALSASAASSVFPWRGPGFGVVVLSDDKKLPPVVSSYISTSKAREVYGIGGQADAALANVKHQGLVGADRYQTSYLVAKTFYGNWEGYNAPQNVGFATGTTWPDALAGGALMARLRGPLLLVNPASGLPSAETQGWLSGWAPSITSAYIFGGTAALGPNVPTAVGGDIAGPAGITLKNNPKV